jgi:histidinol dehydrogenase
MSTLFPILNEASAEFDAALSKLVRRGSLDFDAVEPVVRDIVAGVRSGGDEAVLRYIERFEHRTPAALVRGVYDGKAAFERLPQAVRDSLVLAAERIERYHRRQWEVEFRGGGFSYEEEGIRLGMRVRPMRRVGVYAPGGKARYPSSVLMSAIPACVAGVREIVLATPAPDDSVLAAAYLASVNTVLDAGGAHAIAALAYGTESLRRVDKIAGPGNAFVACAKRLVFGDVAIDSIAGPSEILVLADEHADPTLCAADLLSQAEHDEASYAVLVTTSSRIATETLGEVARQLDSLDRKSIATEALRNHGAIFVVGSEARLVEVADLIAAEHVSFHLQRADDVAQRIDGIGAALLGAETPVAAADYIAGPSHVLPTGGCVRFGSPLGVHDFVVRSSMIRYSIDALRRHGPHIETLARSEGLTAHARAVELRLRGPAGS